MLLVAQTDWVSTNTYDIIDNRSNELLRKAETKVRVKLILNSIIVHLFYRKLILPGITRVYLKTTVLHSSIHAYISMNFFRFL